MVFLTLVCVLSCSVVSDSFVTPWTVAIQGISQAKKLERSPFPSPADLPDLGIKHISPALAGRFLTTESPGKLSPSI